MPGQFATAQTLQDALAALQKQDYPEALRILRPLAERGDAKAQNNLGKMFEQGLGVAKDDTEAMNWYRKSAEQGLAEAQYNLGLMFREGQGSRKTMPTRCIGIANPPTRAMPRLSVISDSCTRRVWGFRRIMRKR